jgi:translation elongation factor EF-Ts
MKAYAAIRKSLRYVRDVSMQSCNKKLPTKETQERFDAALDLLKDATITLIKAEQIFRQSDSWTDTELKNNE